MQPGSLFLVFVTHSEAGRSGGGRPGRFIRCCISHWRKRSGWGYLGTTRYINSTNQKLLTEFSFLIFAATVTLLFPNSIDSSVTLLSMLIVYRRSESLVTSDKTTWKGTLYRAMSNDYKHSIQTERYPNGVTVMSVNVAMVTHLLMLLCPFAMVSAIWVPH